MHRNQNNISMTIRIFGWLVAIVYLLGLVAVFSWVDGLDLPTILLAILAMIFGLFGWAGFMFLNMQFDLFYDRPEHDD
jgi:fatty acid desaturase